MPTRRWVRAESHPSRDSSIHSSIHNHNRPSTLLHRQAHPSIPRTYHSSREVSSPWSVLAWLGETEWESHTLLGRDWDSLFFSFLFRQHRFLSLTPGPAAGFRRTLCLLRMVFLPPHSSPYNFIPAPSTKPLHAKTNAVLLTSIILATRALSIHRPLAAANSSLRIHALCGERQVRGWKFS